jgi:hypothetical protein
MPATRYRAFLLRVWRIDTPDRPAWRASLEDPHTRQVARFDSPEALLAFVRALDNEDGAAPAPGDGDDDRELPRAPDAG